MPLAFFTSSPNIFPVSRVFFRDEELRCSYVPAAAILGGGTTGRKILLCGRAPTLPPPPPHAPITNNALFRAEQVASMVS